MRPHGTNFFTSSARFAPSSIGHPNIPKCTQVVRNDQNVSLGSNGVDRVRSLLKIPTRLHGTNFCTSSARFAPSFIRQPNGPKMHPNSMKRTKTSVYGLMGCIGCVRCEKFRRDFVVRTFALLRPLVHRVS